MTRLDRIKLAIQKGFTYNEITGKIYGIRGKEITKKNDVGSFDTEKEARQAYLDVKNKYHII